MVITIGSQKGGSGKTTIATNLALCLNNCLLVDADPQKSAQEFITLRGKDDVNYRNESGDLRKTLSIHRKHYSHVIVDVAGRDSKELRSALFATDLLIVPVMASTYDVATLDKMEYIIEEVRKENKNLQVYILLNKIPPHLANKLAPEAKKYLKDNYDFKIFNAYLCNRISYQTAVTEGVGVTEKNKYRYAGDEMTKLVKELKRINK